MQQETVTFEITRLAAVVPEGVPVEWQGREFNSGPLTIELDGDVQGCGGVLDYSRRRAELECPVKVEFPEFAGVLESLGVDPTLTEPIRALLRSEGDILDDHSFALTGRCSLIPHALFPEGEAAASVLPGH